jgi:hypothetical protein
MRRFVALIAAVGFVITPALVLALPLPGAPNCPMFPADNHWNQTVNRLPVAANSARYIAAIGLHAPVHPDFGTVWDGAPTGIPLHQLDQLTGRDFEVVDTSSLPHPGL